MLIERLIWHAQSKTGIQSPKFNPLSSKFGDLRALVESGTYLCNRSLHLFLSFRNVP